MSIQIYVNYRHFRFSKTEQTIAQAAVSRSALSKRFQDVVAKKQVDYTPKDYFSVRRSTLQRMIVKYSEQLVYKPIEEIQNWFTYNTGAFLEPGYPPLFYSRDNHKTISPSKSAIAGIGEGVTGFIAQQMYQARLLARPNHDYPDMVMTDGHRTYLLESKATTQSETDLQRTLDEELGQMLVYTSSCNSLDTVPVSGILVGTALLNAKTYHCYITEIQV
jgi:hypothetical protein